jgi:hypothetical protein
LRRGCHITEPGGQSGQLTRREHIADRVSPALRGHQPSFAERLQMGGDRGLGHIEEFGEVAGADPWLCREALQDAPAHRMREGPQYIYLIEHSISISP